jgi:hypothetical protein
MVEVNARIREVAGRAGPEAPEWEFFCECGDPECHERVTLALPEYERLRERREPILTPGHRIDQRTRARALVEDARALKEQAKHQLGRARRRGHLR